MLMNSMVIGKTLVRFESLWEANMEYIDPNNALDSRDRHWKNLFTQPHFSTELLWGTWPHRRFFVVDGCSVDGTVKHSILSTEAQVREGAVVEDAVVMSNAIIGKRSCRETCDYRRRRSHCRRCRLMEQRKYKLSVTMKSGGSNRWRLINIQPF